MTVHIKRRPMRDQLTLCGKATDEYCVGEFYPDAAHGEQRCLACIAELKNNRVDDALIANHAYNCGACGVTFETLTQVVDHQKEKHSGKTFTMSNVGIK